MKNTLKYTWLLGLTMVLALGLNTESTAQRGRSSSGRSSYSSSSSSSSYSVPRYSAPSSSGQMRSGGSMGSGVKSDASSTGSMRSGGTMGSGAKSDSNTAASGKMRSGGAMNSTPAPMKASTGSRTQTNDAGAVTKYRYKTYSGPRETTYNGRQVYINVNGGYSYSPSGPIIAYMPGYTPVVYTQSSGMSFGFVLLIILGIAIMFAVIALILNKL